MSGACIDSDYGIQSRTAPSPETAPTTLSDVSSVRLIVKDWFEVEPSVEVAITVTIGAGSVS